MTTDEQDARAERAAAWERLHREPIDDAAALAFHVRASWGLERALGLLGKAGVPALVVKGAILAHQLYESPIDRPLRDVDLRVRPRDLERATRALLSDSGTKQLVASAGYRSAVLSLRGVEIDLETTIGPPFLRQRLGVEDVMARAVHSVEPLGFAHVRPDLEDHALLLAINLFKDHVLPNLCTVEDLVRIARRGEFDRVRFAQRVAQAGVTTIVHVVARYVAETRTDALAGARSPTSSRRRGRVTPSACSRRSAGTAIRLRSWSASKRALPRMAGSARSPPSEWLRSTRSRS